MRPKYSVLLSDSLLSVHHSQDHFRGFAFRGHRGSDRLVNQDYAQIVGKNYGIKIWFSSWKLNMTTLYIIYVLVVNLIVKYFKVNLQLRYIEIHNHHVFIVLCGLNWMLLLI